MTATTASASLSWGALKPYLPLLVALWIAEVTGSFEAAMILAAMRPLLQDFGDPVALGWLISTFGIVGAASAAVVGRLGDLFGRRRLLTFVLVIVFLGSLISAFAPNFGWLLFGRTLQGLSGAVLALCIGLVREKMPASLVPMGIGLMISGASLGTAAGLVLGGWIADNFSWPGIFVASAAFCASTILACLLWVTPSSRLENAGKTDWLSGVLFAPGTLGLLYYAASLSKTGWNEPLSLAALLTGGTLLAIWVWHSLRIKNPLFDIRLLTRRDINIPIGVSTLVALSSLQITLVFAVLLQTPAWTGIGIGVTAFLAGLAKLPSNILSTFAGPLGGWLTGRGGGRTTMLFGGCLATLGWVLACFFHHDYWTVVAVLCIISFGTTILFSVAPTIMAMAAPPDRVSEVVGMLSVVRGLFSAIGSMMVTLLLASETLKDPASNASYPTIDAYHLTVTVIAGFAILATITAFALPKGKIEMQ